MLKVFISMRFLATSLRLFMYRDISSASKNALTLFLFVAHLSYSLVLQLRCKHYSKYNGEQTYLSVIVDKCFPQFMILAVDWLDG